MHRWKLVASLMFATFAVVVIVGCGSSGSSSDASSTGSAATSGDTQESPVEANEEIYEEAEETISGPACQEDLTSEACREEATVKEEELAEKAGLSEPAE
jgi:hypothetical protein